MSTSRHPLNRRHRFQPEVISRAVWLYFRFLLSLRTGVDQNGFALLVQRHRDTAAQRLMKKRLKSAVAPPPEMITDKVRLRRARASLRA
jgi:transposase-like protein